MRMGIRRPLLFILLFFILCHASRGSEGNMHPTAPGKEAYVFVENKGQITDQYNNTRGDIDFKMELPGMTVFIGCGQLHYQWYNGNASANRVATYRLDMQLKGSVPHVSPAKEAPAPYHEYYYTAGKQADAASYQKITYKNVYPGIDWVLYCSNGHLKYDFVVHKGALPSNIRMQYSGATNIVLEHEGLLVTTPMGKIHEDAPYTYESATGKTIPSHFTLHENEISFTIAPSGMPIVIDPVVGYVTYYGDNNVDEGNAAAADNRGNAYLAGTTSSTANIATTGAHQVLLQGQADGFLVAFDIQGNRKWATYFGGADSDNCNDAVCDPAGNIYVVGKTSSTTAIATPGAHQPLHSGGASDGFIIKFRRDGSREWGTYFGGASADAVNNITCDALGSVFICGSTSSTNNISFNNPHQANLAGQTDGFVARFTPQGQRQWATYYGGTQADAINFNACDLFGNLYVYGTTQSGLGIATLGAHQTAINTAAPTTFLAKFNVAGTVQWATYFGGAAGATPGGVVCDASGDVYLCGATSSNTGIATPIAQQPNISGGMDGFLTRFSSSGGQTWGTYYGNAGQDYFTGIAINAKGRLFLSGNTGSNTGMTTPGALQSALNGVRDVHVSEWNTGGSLVYASYLGGNDDEMPASGSYGSFIEYNFGKIYLCGTTNSTADLSTPNAHRPSFSGGTSDAFFASQVVDTISYVLANQFTDTTLCEGQSFNLPYDVTLPFGPTNIFNAELSDASGSFAGAIIIGSTSSATGGFIPCNIPFGALPGTGYKIRLVSNQPVYTSIDNGVNIKIDNIPPTPTISNGSPGCIGDTLKMSVANPQPGISYLWDGPGYTGVAVSVSFNKATQAIVGLYTITPSIGACTGVDATTNVTVKPTPAIVSKTTNAPICEGETLQLDATSDSANVTYEWKGPSFTAAVKNPTIPNITAAGGGIYTVTSTLNGCTSKKDTLQIDIKHKPVPVLFSNSPVCETDTLAFWATDSELQTGYTWAGPEGFSSAADTNKVPSITPQGAGMYIVTATNNGCTTIDTLEVAVKPMPFPQASNNSPLCSGEKLELHVVSQQNTTTYNWFGPDDFNRTEQNPVVEQARNLATGIYRVIANLDGCVQEDTTYVKVTQAPVTIITTNSPVYTGQLLQIFASNNLNDATYKWTGPANFNADTRNIEINDVKKEHAGYYVLTTTYENCSATDSIDIEVQEFLGYEVFILYPNPNNGEFTLKGVVLKDMEIPVTICDMAGHMLYSNKFKTVNRQLDRKVELANRLASGVYILTLRVDGKEMQKRFTILR